MGMSAGKIDTVAEILRFTADGSSKKALQDKTGLTSDLLDKYLVLLESKNLVRILRDEKGKSESVKATERGIKFLDLYDAMHVKYLSISHSK